MHQILHSLQTEWYGGALAGLVVGWVVGSTLRRRRQRQTQHAGNNSTQIQVGDTAIGGLGVSRFAHGRARIPRAQTRADDTRIDLDTTRIQPPHREY